MDRRSQSLVEPASYNRRSTMDALELDPRRQMEAKRYAGIRRALALGELALGGAYLSVWVATSWAAQARDALIEIAESLGLPSGPSQALTVLGVAAAVGVPWWLATGPLDYLSGFVLPHRFGLSNQTGPGWVIDKLKASLIGAGLGGFSLAMLYLFLDGFPETWWLWASAGYGTATVVLTVLGPVLFIPLFFRMVPLGEKYAETAARLERLAAAAGVRIQGVYSLDLSRRTKAANAVLVGMGRTRRILVGDTLLESFGPDETETILAHELGHHAHHDLPVGIVVHTLSMAVVFAASHLLLTRFAGAGHLMSLDDPAGIPILALTLSALGLVEAPFLNFYSRWRESRADDYAVRLTGNGPAFARAMTRLGNQNLGEAVPPRWAVVFFGTHPPLQQRIERSLSLARAPKG
jgi:STE24 endopeptidase